MFLGISGIFFHVRIAAFAVLAQVRLRRFSFLSSSSSSLHRRGGGGEGEEEEDDDSSKADDSCLAATAVQTLTTDL